ncbi:HNH endonuclease [Nafulsella turpanensis]|uniref:HNH endonuclease n=1 Tax=Nafulsella turpanensis TaxID=1265690 RepID=UPI000349DC1C|nr:HNH endonuclease [Nafulsella turpanensis]
MRPGGKEKSEKQCALCERFVRLVSMHHLVPKQKGGKHGETVPLCQPCHSTIHYTFSNTELAGLFNSVAALQQAPRMEKYLNWIRRRGIEKVSNKRSRS